MSFFDWKKEIYSFDERRNLIILDSKQEMILFSVKQLLEIGQNAIEKKGSFSIALSGGNTPHAIFQELSQVKWRSYLDWEKVLCFWSDERSVPPSHPDSNYSGALQAGLDQIPIPKAHFFRMKAEEEIEKNSQLYEELIKEHLSSHSFDLVMLGMGEDGHTASLFPYTHALHTNAKLVVANYIPYKKTWRMSLTYECIHLAQHISIYITGKNKAAMVARSLTDPYDPDQFPIQRIGTPTHKALWILDREAAAELVEKDFI